MEKTSLTYHLPNGWVLVSLQEIILLEYGRNLIGKDRKEGAMLFTDLMESSDITTTT